MKYMILAYGSQQDYDAPAGRPDPGRPAWSAEDVAAMGAFMEKFSRELAESGELAETRGLTAPVHRHCSLPPCSGRTLESPPMCRTPRPCSPGPL